MERSYTDANIYMESLVATKQFCSLVCNIGHNDLIQPEIQKT